MLPAQDGSFQMEQRMLGPLPQRQPLVSEPSPTLEHGGRRRATCAREQAGEESQYRRATCAREQGEEGSQYRRATCAREQAEEASQYTSAPWGRAMASASTGTVAHSIVTLTAPSSHAVTAACPAVQEPKHPKNPEHAAHDLLQSLGFTVSPPTSTACPTQIPHLRPAQTHGSTMEGHGHNQVEQVLSQVELRDAMEVIADKCRRTTAASGGRTPPAKGHADVGEERERDRDGHRRAQLPVREGRRRRQGVLRMHAHVSMHTSMPVDCPCPDFPFCKVSEGLLLLWV